jgi:hypothetical protein
MRNRRSFGFLAMPGRPERQFRDNSRSGQLATKLQVEAIFVTSERVAQRSGGTVADGDLGYPCS